MKNLFKFLSIRLRCFLEGHHYHQVDDTFSYCINCGKPKWDKHFMGHHYEKDLPMDKEAH